MGNLMPQVDIFVQLPGCFVGFDAWPGPSPGNFIHPECFEEEVIDLSANWVVKIALSVLLKCS